MDRYKAIGFFERALAVDISTFGEDHPKVALDWNNLGAAWERKGQYDKAIEYYEKALAIYKVFGGRSSRYLTALPVWSRTGVSIYIGHTPGVARLNMKAGFPVISH